MGGLLRLGEELSHRQHSDGPEPPEEPERSQHPEQPGPVHRSDRQPGRVARPEPATITLQQGWGCYTPPQALANFVEDAAAHGDTIRAWRFRNRWTSAKIGRDLYKKDFLFPNAEALGAFIDELSCVGFNEPRPSSYGWPWHQRVKTPRSSLTTLDTLERRFGRASTPFAWQEAFPGKTHAEKRELAKCILTGPWKVYDLRSAYAWAAYQHLPDPRTAVHVQRPSGHRPFGLYLIRGGRFGAGILPPRFRYSVRQWWVTNEELEQLDAQDVDFVYGIEFQRAVDLRPHLDWMMDRLTEPTWKRVFRAFWGAWGMKRGPEEVIFKDGQMKVRELPTLSYNPVWTYFLMSRVNLKLVPVALGSAHIFVDSVIVPYQLPEGPHLGDWKLVETLPQVEVRATGTWGNGQQLIKHAGKREEG